MPMTAGVPRGQRATRRALLHHGGQSPARRSQRTESRPLSMAARAASRSRSSSDGSSPSGSWSSGPGTGTPARASAVTHLGQTLELHVEVAHVAEQAAQPAQLLAEGLGPDGQDVGEQAERGAQASGRHAHVVQFLGVLPEPRARFLLAQHGELPAQHGEGEVAHGRRRRRSSVGPRSGEPGISWPSASSPASNLERLRRLEPARRAQLLARAAPARRATRAAPRPRPARSCIGRWPLPTTMMVSSSATSAASTPPTRKRKGPAARAHLEHLAQRACADDGTQAPPDRAVGPERGRRRTAGGPR